MMHAAVPARAAFSVLLACEANACRSPLIAFEASRAWPVEAVSAGANAANGAAICPLAAQRISTSRKGRLFTENFRSTPLNALDIGSFDLVLAVTMELRAELSRTHPPLHGNMFTVLEALALSRAPLTRAERGTLGVLGPAAVLLARRGTVATGTATERPRRWGSRLDPLDIPDGHNGRRTRHHLATVERAATAGTELGTLLLDWWTAADPEGR